MFFRPTSRLFAVKFLGLFGTSAKLDDGDRADGLKVDPTSCSVATETNTRTHKAEHSSLDRAVDLSSKKIVDLLLLKGIPGLTICVSKGGETVWKSSFGYCDVENQVQCDPDARMRVASISKSMFTSVIVGPAIDDNPQVLKSSIHQYLSEQEFPKQSYDGKQVDITIEQLLSHRAGIRSYNSDDQKASLRPIASKGSQKVYQCDDQYELREFYTRKLYRSVVEALEPFKDDPLSNEPGKYKYTTYGFVLLSAVFERFYQKHPDLKNKLKLSERVSQIEDIWIEIMRRIWSLQETSLDHGETIIPKRAHYYLRTGNNGSLINAPFTDLSVKWAGGGLISTASDLVKFGNKLIDAYKGRENAPLKRGTVELLWEKTSDKYGLGFELHPLNAKNEKVAIYHTGSALGASSILVILPETETVVAILTNLSDINLRQTGLYIAEQFINC